MGGAKQTVAAEVETGGLAGADRHGDKADALNLFRIGPHDRIKIIREGLHAQQVTELAQLMGVSKEFLLTSLGFSRATINRKERDGAVLSSEESERIVGLQTLIGMVQSMVEESGNPEGFDAARWVGDWMSRPLPALAFETPASYMDTIEGQRLVSALLAMSQSGAYT